MKNAFGNHGKILQRASSNLRKAMKEMPDSADRIISEVMYILICSVGVGADVAQLTETTGCSRELVESVAANMEANRLWISGNVDDFEWWHPGDDVNMERIFTHALVAIGEVRRTLTSTGVDYVDPKTGEVLSRWNCPEYIESRQAASSFFKVLVH